METLAQDRRERGGPERLTAAADQAGRREAGIIGIGGPGAMVGKASRGWPKTADFPPLRAFLSGEAAQKGDFPPMSEKAAMFSDKMPSYTYLVKFN